MNFGLATNSQVFTFEELCSDDVEIVSGGSGGGSSILDSIMAAGAGVASIYAGASLLSSMTGAGAAVFAAGVTTFGLVASAAVGVGAIVGGIGLVGYAIFG